MYKHDLCVIYFLAKESKFTCMRSCEISNKEGKVANLLNYVSFLGSESQNFSTRVVSPF